MLNITQILLDFDKEYEKRQAEEARNFNTSDEVLKNELLTAEYHDVMIKVMNHSVDGRYSETSGSDRNFNSRNSQRVQNKLRYQSEARNADDNEYWNYLLSTQYGSDVRIETKVTRVNANYDFNFSSLGLPWTKKTKQEVYTKASVKKVKKLPKSTYIVEDKEQHGEYKQSKNFDTVIVKDFYIFKEMVILEVEKKFDINTRVYRREFQGKKQEEQNFYYIFRYEPVDKNGNPNPYCGLRQLNTFLKTVPAVIAVNPQTLGEALRALIGSEIEVPEVPTYEYATSTTYCKEDEKRIGDKVHRKFDKVTVDYDSRTIYKFYGEIDYLISCMTTNRKESEYQKISEYVDRDEDSFGYETIKPKVYGVSVNKKFTVIGYECHKEFSAAIPLMYSHISSIFD